MQILNQVSTTERAPNLNPVQVTSNRAHLSSYLYEAWSNGRVEGAARQRKLGAAGAIIFPTPATHPCQAFMDRSNA